MTVKTNLNIAASILEESAQDLGTASMTHLLSLVKGYGNGTSAGQFDVVYSDTHTAAGSAKTYDVLGSLSSVLTGSAISFVTLCGIIVKNKSTTSTEILSIGAGANPVTGLWIATGDGIKVGPSGMFVWLDPVDGIAPVAATGDTLTIDPGADTIEFDIILLGRSA